MKKNQSSLTAEYMALFRALESRRSAEKRLFDDPYAHVFLCGWRRTFYALASSGAGRKMVERLLDRSAPGARAAGIARTQWIDAEVTQALATVSQLVLLGAGFDTRPLRLPAAQRAQTFELDHPDTGRAKQEVLRRHLGSLPERLRFVAIDFNRQSLREALDRAGFDASSPACFIWEGVTNYLTAEAIDGTFCQIAEWAAGSVVIFTYIDRRVLEDPSQFDGAAKLMTRLGSYGEPWLTGFRPDGMGRYLAERGLRLMREEGIAQIWERSGRSRQNALGYAFYRVASARVGMN